MTDSMNNDRFIHDKRDFIDMSKLRILRGGNWIVMGVLMRDRGRQERRGHRQRSRGREH